MREQSFSVAVAFASANGLLRKSRSIRGRQKCAKPKSILFMFSFVKASTAREQISQWRNCAQIEAKSEICACLTCEARNLPFRACCERKSKHDSFLSLFLACNQSNEKAEAKAQLFVAFTMRIAAPQKPHCVSAKRSANSTSFAALVALFAFASSLSVLCLVGLKTETHSEKRKNRKWKPNLQKWKTSQTNKNLIRRPLDRQTSLELASPVAALTSSKRKSV